MKVNQLKTSFLFSLSQLDKYAFLTQMLWKISVFVQLVGEIQLDLTIQVKLSKKEHTVFELHQRLSKKEKKDQKFKVLFLIINSICVVTRMAEYYFILVSQTIVSCQQHSYNFEPEFPEILVSLAITVFNSVLTLLSLTEHAWQFRNNALWDTLECLHVNAQT